MPFRSAELKRLYELLIDVGHPISASRAGSLFRSGDLAQYVEDVIGSIIPPICTLGETKCVGYDLHECQEVLGKAAWVLKEENSEACGYVPPPPPPDIKEEGIRLYQARLDAFFIWGRMKEEFEYYKDAVSALTRDWFYATKQWNKYRTLRNEWREAEDNYWRNKWEIKRLQRDVDDLKAQLDDLYGQINAWYNEMFDIQDEIDWYEYVVEMYRDSVDYWQDEVDDRERIYWHCRATSPDPRTECKPLWYEWLEAREFLALAEEHLEDALDNLVYWEQLKWLLMRRVDAAWDDVNDVQGQIQELEWQIEEILGVLADYDTIMEQIERFEAFVDYWNSEKWWLEDQLEIAYIKVEMAARRADAAEDEWDIARRAWTRFKKEHPVIAQEILDEW